MADRILVADDEAPTRELLRLYLARVGFIVEEAADGEVALRLARSRDYTLLILDRMMPGIDGLEVCKRLRQAGDPVPILLLTARGQVQDRLDGLAGGADDYLPKPYDPREVVARVQAILRRSRAESEPGGLLLRGELALDPTKREAVFRGLPLGLTPKEFELLHALSRRPGQVFSREQLLDLIWGPDFTGDLRTVDSHIQHLREKLGGAETGKAWIMTVWGLGYKFMVAAK